jgi:hypothetical protein
MPFNRPFSKSNSSRTNNIHSDNLLTGFDDEDNDDNEDDDEHDEDDEDEDDDDDVEVEGLARNFV